MKSYKLFVWNSCVPHVQTLLFWKCSSKEYAFLKLPVWKSYYTQTVLQLLYNSCVNVSKPTHVQRFFSPQYENMYACTFALYTGLLDIWDVLEAAAKSALSLTQKMRGILWTEHLAELAYWWMSMCISAWQCLNVWGTAAYAWNYSQCYDVILAAPQPKVQRNIALTNK